MSTSIFSELEIFFFDLAKGQRAPSEERGRLIEVVGWKSVIL